MRVAGRVGQRVGRAGQTCGTATSQVQHEEPAWTADVASHRSRLVRFDAMNVLELLVDVTHPCTNHGVLFVERSRTIVSNGSLAHVRSRGLRPGVREFDDRRALNGGDVGLEQHCGEPSGRNPRRPAELDVDVGQRASRVDCDPDRAAGSRASYSAAGSTRCPPGCSSSFSCAFAVATSGTSSCASTTWSRLNVNGPPLAAMAGYTVAKTIQAVGFFRPSSLERVT